MSDEASDAVARAVAEAETLRHMIAEMRAFSSRIMTGYESAHRTIVDMAAQMSKQTGLAQDAVAKALAMQIKSAEEREALVSKQQERDMKLLEAESKRESAAAIQRDFIAVAKLAIKQYLGIPISGNDSHGMQDFLQSMSLDQVSTLMATGTLQLTEAQRVQVATILSSLSDAEQKANGKAVLPEVPS